MISKSTTMAEAIKTPTSPFPGLRPFEFDESHLFFGRDGQVEKLISKLARTRFLAVVGTSGSGKSSLARAGLLPALLGGLMTEAGSKWRIAVMRPGNDPIGSLARALNQPEVFGSEDVQNAAIQIVVAEATLRRGSRGLVETVRQSALPENENVLVVVDQFEELFRFAQEALRKTKDESDRYQNDAAAFVKLLLEASDQRETNIFVVLTMRSDFLGDCAQFWDLPEAINESQYLIPRLTRDQLREVITGPVALGGAEITPRLVTQLLIDIGDNQDQLPVLQHLLMRVWNEWKEKRLEVEVEEEGKTVRKPHSEVHQGEAIDLCCYEAVGGMAQALSRHADEAFNELPDDHHRAVAEKVFKALTEKGPDNREVRRPITLGEICAVMGATAAEVVTIIEVFRRPGRSFLMPPAGVELNSESLIDISHESLIRGWKRLSEWVDEEARSARIYRRLAETTALYKTDMAGLARDPELQIALDWREHNHPTKVWARRYYTAGNTAEFDDAMTFLNDSLAARKAEIADKEARRRGAIKRTRWLAITFGLLFLIAAVALIFATRQTIKANTLAEQIKTNAEANKDNAVKAEQARADRELADERALAALKLSKQAEAAKLQSEKERKDALDAKTEAVKERDKAEEKNRLYLIAAREAEEQRKIAEQARREFEEESKKALEAKTEAVKQRDIAEEQNRLYLIAAREAEEQRKEAEKQRDVAEEQNRLYEEEKSETEELRGKLNELGAKPTPGDGIDITQHSGEVDWVKVKEAGVPFAYLRAATGLRADSAFSRYWLAAKNAGVLRGAYQFLRPNDDPRKQAELFLATVGLDSDLPPAVDVEAAPGITWNAKSLMSALRTWLEIVERGTDCTPMIYTNGQVRDMITSPEFARYPLWIASYGRTSPKLPPAWSKWTLWQYSGTGKVGGTITDLNRLSGSLDDLRCKNVRKP